MTKITKDKFDLVKIDLKINSDSVGLLCNIWNVSVSTLNKIKRCKDFEEYKGKKESNFWSEGLVELIKNTQRFINRRMDFNIKLQQLKNEYSDVIPDNKPTLLQRIKGFFKL